MKNTLYFTLVLILFFSCSSNKSFLLTQGIYQSSQDSLAFISVNKDKFVIGHKTELITPEDIYKYSILDSVLLNEKYEIGKFLLLTNEKDSLLYSGLEYDENGISMFYVPRGNILDYSLIKKYWKTLTNTVYKKLLFLT